VHISRSDSGFLPKRKNGTRIAITVVGEKAMFVEATLGLESGQIGQREWNQLAEAGEW